MSRQDILKFIEEFNSREGKPPSIRVIAKNVDNVSKTSFYDYFPGGINEALNLLGFEGTVEIPMKAMDARKVKPDSSIFITLNRTQSDKIRAIAYMENKSIPMVIDEVLDDQRQVREIMFEVNGGILNSDIIDAILHPDLVYEGYNVSDIAGKPWFILKCIKCGDPLFYGEVMDFNRWVFDIRPFLRNAIKPTCEDCLPKPHSYIRIPA